MKSYLYIKSKPRIGSTNTQFKVLCPGIASPTAICNAELELFVAVERKPVPSSRLENF